MQNLSEDIVLVVMPEEPHVSSKLTAVIDTIDKDNAYHVVLDFSRIEILTSSSISKLIMLRDVLRKHNRRLILCTVPTPTRCIFKVVGMERLFQFCNDKMMALEELEHCQQPKSAV